MTGIFVQWLTGSQRARSQSVGWIEDGSGCHIWTGFKRNGYGRARADGQMRHVHRVRYEREIGPIPEGMELDHYVCSNPGCCNPMHCRPVTHRENSLRSDITRAAIHAAKTHCPRGHPLSGDNLRKSEHGHRSCLTCDRARKAAKRAANPQKGMRSPFLAQNTLQAPRRESHASA